MDIPVHSIAALRKGYAEGRWSVKTVAEAFLVRAAAAEALDNLRRSEGPCFQEVDGGICLRSDGAAARGLA